MFFYSDARREATISETSKHGNVTRNDIPNDGHAEAQGLFKFKYQYFQLKFQIMSFVKKKKL